MTKQKYIVCGLLTVLAIALIYLYSESVEGFQSKREKASAIYEWFKDNPRPQYTKYKQDLNLASNVVEYEDVLKLSQEKNLSLGSVMKILS